jgi:hypothetical protein
VPEGKDDMTITLLTYRFFSYFWQKWTSMALKTTDLRPTGGLTADLRLARIKGTTYGVFSAEWGQGAPDMVDALIFRPARFFCGRPEESVVPPSCAKRTG